MEIKRKTEIIVETKRHFVIRGAETAEQYFCPQCGEALIGVETASALFGISHRAVYRLVEQNAAHFAETALGAVIVCPTSLAVILKDGRHQLPGESVEDLNN